MFQRAGRIRLHSPAVDAVGHVEIREQPRTPESDMRDLICRHAQGAAESVLHEIQVGASVCQRASSSDVVESGVGGCGAAMVARNELDEAVRPSERRVDAASISTVDELSDRRIVCGGDQLE